MHIFGRLFSFELFIKKEINGIHLKKSNKENSKTLTSNKTRKEKSQKKVLQEENSIFSSRIKFLRDLFEHQNQKCGPPSQKCAVRNVSNYGSASIEATIILPVFLFVFLVFYGIGQIFLMENQIYQAGINTAKNMAENVYYVSRIKEDSETEGSLNIGIVAANLVFKDYLGDNQLVNRYVKNGKNGIILSSTEFLDDEGFVNIKINYCIELKLPFMPKLKKNKHVLIKQKAFNGYQSSGTDSDSDSDNRYVYITETGTVYHTTRSCSHLNVTIRSVYSACSGKDIKGYKPCEDCIESESTVKRRLFSKLNVESEGSSANSLIGTAVTEGIFYTTPYGDAYHSSKNCPGLKRTIRRVMLGELDGVSECSECEEKAGD